MALYALSLYGEDFYGVDTVVSYSVGTVSATQTGYGEITLGWTTPKNTENWSSMRLIRNTAGYPSSEEDGNILLDLSSTDPQNTYTDSDLVGGRFYYYAFFLASAFPDYSSGTTYQPGDTVSSGGSNWVCTASNTVGVTPTTSTAQWAATNETALWNRAGQAMSLAVADYGYRELLYDLTPDPYATDQAEISAPQDSPNSMLYRYLSVLAWALDMTRTELGEEQHLNRVDTMPLDRMEHLAAELGAGSEASITPRLRRYRVANSALLNRRKGTLESVKEAIYAATGYDAAFTESGNRLLDADQSEFRYPRYAAWDPSVTYAPRNIVSYNGYLYSATTSTAVVEAESTTVTLVGAPSSVVQGNQTGVVYSNNQQVLIQSNAVGQGATLTFPITVAATYDLSIALTRSFDYGITEFAVDGTSILSPFGPVGPGVHSPIIVDTYAASPAPATSIYLGSFSFTVGNHSITLKVDGKNSKSGTAAGSHNKGYQLGVDYLTYTPRSAVPNTGIAPSGTPTNSAFWAYYTGVQNHALDNSLTGGISTWEQVSFTAGATAANASLGVYSGYLPLDGVGDNTANLGVMKNATGVTATLAAHSIPHARIATWNTTTVYSTGSYVSYNGATYLALLPSQNSQPDADLIHWRPETISTTGPDQFLVSSFGLPLKRTPTWSGGADYIVGDIVQYQGQTYVASAGSHGLPPTGRPTDNLVWAWSDSAQNAYTASAWTNLYGGGTTTTSRSMYIEWYDAAGTLITTTGPSSGADILSTFAHDSANLVTDPGAIQELDGGTWATTSTDVPVSYSGLAYWGTRADTNVTGRHLTTDYGVANTSVGITFVTPPPPGTEQGLLMRWGSTTNFWAASRTRLTKTIAGTLTTVASWAALPDGSRIFATLQGSVITIFRYQGPGLAPVQLATTTDSALSTNSKFGIFERAF